MRVKLQIDDDQLAACVSCGLCLPHCPTYRVTGEEGLSPRGRIAAMRAVQQEGRDVDADTLRFVETCVQCRGCEPACPSGVQFGALMEGTRHTLADGRRITPRWQRAAFAGLARHRLLLAGSSLLAIAQRARLVPLRLGLGRLPIRRRPLHPATGEGAWLYTGCVMDAWQRETHRSTAEVLSALGITYRYPTAGGCCGALHAHAGLHADAARLARRTMASMPGDAPIVVNSAGCGASMKEYGALVGTSEAAAFSRRVFDVHEFIAPQLGRLGVPPGSQAVIVQDPCHLRHVQKAHAAVRQVIGAVARPVELDDEGLCCGAGGAYSALQPELAGAIRERKLASIQRAQAASGATVIVSANPGCAMHLGAAGLTVRHPIDLLAEALR